MFLSEDSLYPAYNHKYLFRIAYNGSSCSQVTQVFEDYLEKQGVANDNAAVVRSQAQRIMSQRQTVWPSRVPPAPIFHHIPVWFWYTYICAASSKANVCMQINDLNDLLQKRDRDMRRARTQLRSITAMPKEGLSLKQLAAQAALAFCWN